MKNYELLKKQLKKEMNNIELEKPHIKKIKTIMAQIKGWDGLLTYKIQKIYNKPAVVVYYYSTIIGFSEKINEEELEDLKHDISLIVMTANGVREYMIEHKIVKEYWKTFKILDKIAKKREEWE